MQIVPSTLLALLLVVMLMKQGPLRGLHWFFIMSPFGAAAAFNMPAVGGATIGIIDLGALVLFALVFSGPNGPGRIAGSMRPGQPGFYLLLLTFYCIVATLVFPRLFAGQTEVFGISRDDNKTEIISVFLRPTTGNITQLFRLMLDVLAFFAAATLFRAKPDFRVVFSAMIAATVVNIVLGWADVLTFAVGLPELLDPIRTANYSMLIDHRMGGLKRMIGGFPEASSFGFYTLGLFGFWLRYWISGPPSRAALWCLIGTAIVMVRSTSSSTYVAVVALLLVMGIFAFIDSLQGRVRKQAMIVTLIVLLAVWLFMMFGFAAYQFVQPVTDFLDSALFDKADSQSGVERMSWNVQAYQNFLDTWLMGAGLGSIRASNWFLACLGSIGLIGTALYLAFLWTLSRLKLRTGDLHNTAILDSLKCACLALLISATLTTPTPDLGIFFFVLAGMIAGLARGTAKESPVTNTSVPARTVAGIGTIQRQKIL